MGPDGAGETVVGFVNKNSDYLQNPRNDSPPTNYDPYQSTAYGYKQRSKRNISDENIDENVYEFVNPLVDPVSKNRALEPKVKTQFDTPPAFKQRAKRNISDENIDENVYEFVNPLVDPVSKNRALEPKVKTQFDTPPTFRQKAMKMKDIMGPDGAGEDVVGFVNKNSDYFQNPRNDGPPTNYDPYYSTAYGFQQKKSNGVPSSGLSHEGYLHAQSVTDEAIPWSDDSTQVSKPAMNGSGERGWGDGLIHRKREEPTMQTTYQIA
jgi:hypothetical protein